jgi:NlpC/P60 family putative phage cell wall peptidase
MATRKQVVDEARTWMGTRFHHQARIKGTGVDCLNLVIGVAETLELVPGGFKWDDYPEYHGYGKSPNGTMLIAGCDRFMDRISYDDLLPGDVLVFRFAEEPQHFAIVTQIGSPVYMLHSFAHMRRVVEHSMDKVWHERIVGCYRFRGITE